MTSRPIIFSPAMAREIIEGRKTMTRRIVSPQPHAGVRKSPFVPSGVEDGHGREVRPKYGVPGDRLWVRHSFWLHQDGSRAWDEFPGAYERERDGDVYDSESAPSWAWLREEWKKKPSIHMPRWASRITLEVCSVRIERLQQITFADIRKESVECPEHDFPGGMCCSECPSLRQAFRDLWTSIHGDKHPWEKNEWVWVIEFRRVGQEAGR